MIKKNFFEDFSIGDLFSFSDQRYVKITESLAVGTVSNGVYRFFYFLGTGPELKYIEKNKK